MRTIKSYAILFCLAVSLTASASASDWTRFRGPNGTGVSPDGMPLPISWSETENLKWKLALPGPGHSCPIIVGDRIFLTCWTGYGLDRDNLGEQENLKRNLLCIDRPSGEILWNEAVPAVLPEDKYEGMFAEHGYTTHTPVSNGEKVFVFYGKSGVVAYDMEGKQLWHKMVGDGLDERRWGSSCSPILYENLVIITACPESHSLVAFDQDTGEEVWNIETEGLTNTWGTPILSPVDNERTDLVIAVPGEIWGLNPTTGKTRWYLEALGTNSMCSSAITNDGIIYLMESGRGGGGAVAVRAGGKGDVADTHVLWNSSVRNRIGTPVYQDGKLYCVARRVVNCVDATTGESIYQERLEAKAKAEDASEAADDDQGGGRGRGRRGPGNRDYSSPVSADGKLFYVGRNGDMFVIALGDEFEQLAHNRFDSDDGEFTASPAISNGEIFIRSTKNLYCIGQE